VVVLLARKIILVVIVFEIRFCSALQAATLMLCFQERMIYFLKMA
jgi:hypothetical protein